MSTPCFCTNLRLATRKLTAIYDAALAPLGINIGQYFLLRTIDRHGGVSLTALGSLTGLDRSTAGRNVRVLERMGLARTGRGKSDSREALVSLTPKGRDLLPEALPLWEGCQEAFAARLGRDNIAALGTVLAAI